MGAMKIRRRIFIAMEECCASLKFFESPGGSLTKGIVSSPVYALVKKHVPGALVAGKDKGLSHNDTEN